MRCVLSPFLWKVGAADSSKESCALGHGEAEEGKEGALRSLRGLVAAGRRRPWRLRLGFVVRRGRVGEGRRGAVGTRIRAVGAPAWAVSLGPRPWVSSQS